MSSSEMPQPSDGVGPPTGRRFGRIAWSGLLALLPLVFVLAGFLPPGFGLLTVGVLVGALMWPVRQHVPSFLLVCLLAALAGTLVARPWPNMVPDRATTEDAGARAAAWAASGVFDGNLPIVLHLVFDELLSPGGPEPDLPGAGATVDAMRRLASTHQLRLYDSVYSRYYYSGVSLPNLMDAEYRGETSPGDVVTAIMQPSADNAYFADMSRRGYRTAVFQTAVIDFCLPATVEVCETFPSHDPGAVEATGLDEQTRAVYLWDTLLRAFAPGYLPEFGRWIIRRVHGIDRRELGVLGAADRFDAQGFPSWFDRFRHFIREVPRGSHVFAHFMAPHSPYVLTETCVVTGNFDAGYGLAERVDDDQVRIGARRTYYDQYLRQTRCVLSKLDTLLSELSELPAFQDALIVIHGDHGSRISSGALLETVSPRDMVDNYATFFAVRGPGIEPGTDCTFTSLPQVVRQVLRGADAGAIGEALPVLVSTRAGTQVRIERAMPAFGCAATARPPS